MSLFLTTRADRIGRRRMLIVGAMLMAAAGLTFACTGNAATSWNRGSDMKIARGIGLPVALDGLEIPFRH